MCCLLFTWYVQEARLLSLAAWYLDSFAATLQQCGMVWYLSCNNNTYDARWKGGRTAPFDKDYLYGGALVIVFNKCPRLWITRKDGGRSDKTPRHAKVISGRKRREQLESTTAKHKVQSERNIWWQHGMHVIKSKAIYIVEITSLKVLNINACYVPCYQSAFSSFICVSLLWEASSISLTTIRDLSFLSCFYQ